VPSQQGYIEFQSFPTLNSSALRATATRVCDELDRTNHMRGSGKQSGSRMDGFFTTKHTKVGIRLTEGGGGILFVFLGVGRLSLRSKRGGPDRVAGAPRYVSIQRVGDNSLHLGGVGPLAGARSYGEAERQRAGGLRGRLKRAAGGSKMRVGRVL